MTEFPAGAQIWIAAGVTEMRPGFHGRRGDIVKVLWFDGDGLCLSTKRLERGRFVRPQTSSGTVWLTRAHLSMLLESIDSSASVRTAERVMSV